MKKKMYLIIKIMHTLLYRNVISSYLVFVIVLQVDTYGNILVCVHGFEFFNG